MQSVHDVQLADLVNSSNPQAVVEEASQCWNNRYEEESFLQIAGIASRIQALFCGGFNGYHSCDTGYHDIKHTLDVFLATVRMLDGRAIQRGPLPEDLARDLLIAALCHDVGYIRRYGEEEGTGARFTACHVARSAEFVLEHGPSFGLDDESAKRIARIIMATGLKNEFQEQNWETPLERDAGAILGSADLLGQMSDRAYLEKLLFLYYEFREAGIPGYDTEFDILRKTIGFYEMTVTILGGRLLGAKDWARVHFLSRYGVDRNLYDEAISCQMDYLRKILADDSTNFRKKLKRLDLESLAALS